MEFLRKHNIDIEDYERQIQNIVQSYTITVRREHHLRDVQQ